MDLSLLTFLSVVAFVVGSGIWAVGQTGRGPARRSRMRFATVFALAWLVISAVPTLAGVLSPDGPLPPQGLVFVFLAAAVWLGASRVGAGISTAVPLAALIGFQGFRLPLELVLHAWAEAGIAPPQMTWTGQNVDVLTGIIALGSIPVVRRRPGFAWVPTLVGSLLLLNVLRVVALSLPGPLQRFPQAVLLAYRFPQVWIASVCVAGALAGHIIAFRALLSPVPPGEAPEPQP